MLPKCECSHGCLHGFRGFSDAQLIPRRAISREQKKWFCYRGIYKSLFTWLSGIYRLWFLTARRCKSAWFVNINLTIDKIQEYDIGHERRGIHSGAISGIA